MYRQLCTGCITTFSLEAVVFEISLKLGHPVYYFLLYLPYYEPSWEPPRRMRRTTILYTLYRVFRKCIFSKKFNY